MSDRSLSFFVTIANQQNNPDSQTGMSTSSHEVQYNIKKYDPNNPLKGTTSENKTTNYTVVNSLQSEGEFINYVGNSSTNNYIAYTPNPEHESDIKLSSIIEWTQQEHPSMKLNIFHFAYLKDFRTYPANRLMILRRYNDGVPHDLFNCSVKPINTMVSYYSLEEPPFKIGFSEEWTDFTSSIMELLEDVIGIKFNSVPGIGKIIEAAQNVTPSNLQQTVIEAIGQKLGLISKGEAIYGDPNIIYQAKIRKADGENMQKSGLKTDIKINFKTTYVLREIKGIDAKVAMLDIIANAVSMGTSNARFILTHNGNDKLNKIISAMQNGNVDALLDEIIEGISDIVSKSTELLSDLISSIATDVSQAAQGNTAPIVSDVLAVAGKIIKNRFSRYKWQLRGAIGALSGQHTAPWHITIGNPKFPWFTCGNLVVDNVNLDFGGELAYNDMPTELTVTIGLSNGRPLGAQEITSLFNNGKGRIYDTPDKIQTLKVPQDQQLQFNDSGAVDPSITETNAPTDTTEDVSNSPTDTDSTQQVENSSDFSNGTQEEDKNVPSTEQTSTKGFIYTLKTQGPNKYYEVRKNATLVYTGKKSFSATEAELLNEAKAAVGDNGENYDDD